MLSNLTDGLTIVFIVSVMACVLTPTLVWALTERLHAPGH